MVRLPRPLPVHVINLDRDTQRWDDTREAFGSLGRFELSRTPGVVATGMPALAMRLLSGAAHQKYGTLGCFLAHVAAWEKVAATRRGWGLVIEDDVMPRAAERLFRVSIPDDADIVWVNRRMDPGCAVEDPKVPQVFPARTMLPLKAALPPGRAAPGGDGYLLSREGARKLLAAVEADRIRGHVDWTLLRYAVAAEDVSAAAEGSWLSTHPVMAPANSDLQWSVVTGYCLSPFLLRERPGRDSSRRDADGKTVSIVSEDADGAICAFTAAGRLFRMLVANPKDTIQKHHYAGRFYEPEELDIIQRHLAPGSVYVDIGANVGNHAVYVASVLAPSQVVVFEPNPDAIRILRANIALNGLNAIVDDSNLGIGLSDAPGRAVVQQREMNLGASRLGASEEGGIELNTGDALLAGRKVDFVKIDVEGMEHAVLRGLDATISRSRPSIFVEVDDRNRAAVDEWVASRRYRVVAAFRRYSVNENLMLMPAEAAVA